MCEQAPISVGSEICDTCRRRLKRSPIIAETSDDQVEGDNGGDIIAPETEQLTFLRF